MKGRRREDTVYGDLPEDLRPGDYWKYLDAEGNPQRAVWPSNLTRTVWGFMPPVKGIGVGRLEKHTVREHDDGTISVLPGDGSSNSILVSGGRGQQWHGYIREGVWESV